jgi:hypothetical protein
MMVFYSSTLNATGNFLRIEKALLLKPILISNHQLNSYKHSSSNKKKLPMAAFKDGKYFTD